MAVQISVYIVHPRRTKQASNQIRRTAHGHREHLYSGDCYDRKAQLLLYSQRLRAVACSKQPPVSKNSQPQPKEKEVNKPALTPNSESQKKAKEASQIASETEALQKGKRKPVQISSSAISKTNLKEAHQTNPTSSWKVVPVGRKQGNGELPRPPPSCFGDWKQVILPELLLRAFAGRGRRVDKNEQRRKLKCTLGKKMNAIIINSRIQKERVGVIAKLLASIRKGSWQERMR